MVGSYCVRTEGGKQGSSTSHELMCARAANLHSNISFLALAQPSSIYIQSTFISRILEGDHIPSGGQKSAQNLNEVGGEPKEYEYEYYDDTVPDSPFVNPFDTSHQSQQFLMAGDLAGHLAQRVFTTTIAPPIVPGQPTTPPAKRFFPPGQIKLDRFPQGFNFQFQSQK